MHVDLAEPKVREYTVDEAFAYCAEITNRHYENFPVASLLFPADKRPYIQAIYAFSRIADDFADEGSGYPEAKLAKLNDWEESLKLCYQGVASHPVFIALAETVKRHEIPMEPLQNLLTAFRQDVIKNRYETFQDVLEYCSCSANPVGRLVLMVFGYKDPKLYKLSDSICTALQLANFWQDIAVDLKKDRLYIPLEDLQRYRYSVEDWKEQRYDERFKEVMNFQIERTRQMFYDGAELPVLVNKDLEVELKLVWFGGMEILKKIKKIDYNLYKEKPIIRMRDKFLILVRAFWYGDLTRYGIKKKKGDPWDLA
jgi:phytoene synthase